MTNQSYRDQVEMHLNAFNGGLIKNRREDNIVDMFFQQHSEPVEAARRIIAKRA